MSKKQKTIQSEISLSGVGLHTGNNVIMTLKPAPINHGFSFVRVDLEGKPEIEALAEYVVNTQRGTNLEKNGVQIQTSWIYGHICYFVVYFVVWDWQWTSKYV